MTHVELADMIPGASRSVLEHCKRCFEIMKPEIGLTEQFLIAEKIRNREHDLEMLEFMANQIRSGDKDALGMASRCFNGKVFTPTDELIFKQYLRGESR